MKVLIIGNGGREAAIAWKLKDDPKITKLFFTGKNATNEDLGEIVTGSSIEELKDFAIKEQIDLTIVGPEAPLVEGIVDEFEKNNLRIFGANKKAALLEGSKAFAKDFMFKHGVKTAQSKTFTSYDDAVEYTNQLSYPLVVKASGLAAGKGVVICENKEEATKTLKEFMLDKVFGSSGNEVVIEEFLDGFEASVIAFSNGEKLFPCVSVKDYKRAETGDLGLNTGGMGTVAPNPYFTEAHMLDFEKNILNPTLEGIKKDHLDFKGFIFFGVMVCNDQCYLLEYNMRMGDPETQVILPLLENNLLDVIQDCLDGKDVELRFKDHKAICLVVVSGGYPGDYEVGKVIEGVNDLQESNLLIAGAIHRENDIVTSGGRVLNIVATGKTYEDAREKVYRDAQKVKFEGSRYREDIGKIN